MFEVWNTEQPAVTNDSNNYDIIVNKNQQQEIENIYVEKQVYKGSNIPMISHQKVL